MDNLVDSRQVPHLLERSSELEVKCLANYSLNNSQDGTMEACIVGPTQPGVILKKKCSEIFEESFSEYASSLIGFATRECLVNGSWSQGNVTNYAECEESFQFYLQNIEEDNILLPIVHHMLFYGSVLSLLCLGVSLAVFYNFRCLQCDRVTVHVQLMLSLVLRFLLMFVIVEPFIFGHTNSYRDVEILCKTTLVLFLYSTFSSVSWMFVEGLFLNISLMKGVAPICTRRQLIVFHLIGWGVPAIFVGIFVLCLVATNNETCWDGYSKMDAMWILVGPIGFQLVVNGSFLINILRILIRKIHNSNTQIDTSKPKAAAKAIAILFPVLGINNLLLLYNPGGVYNKYFVLLNTFFGSTQGIMVATVLCFVDKDVRAAIQRSLNRANVRRFANTNRGQNRGTSQLTPMIEMLTFRENDQHGLNRLEHTV